MAAAVDTQYRRLCRFSPIRLSSGVNLQSGGISTFWMVPHFHTSEILMGEAYSSVERKGKHGHKISLTMTHKHEISKDSTGIIL